MLVHIKYFCLFSCSLYTTAKIINQVPNIKKNLIQSFFLSTLVVLLDYIFPNQYIFVPLFLYFCINYITQKNMRLTFVSSMLSYAFTLAIMTFAGFIISAVLSPFRSLFDTPPLPLLTIFTCIMSPYVIYKTLSIRRLKSGMPFLQSSTGLSVGMFLSLAILAVDIYIHYIPAEAKILSATCQLCACLLILPLIGWWRSQLTRSYQQYLRDMEMQRLTNQANELIVDNQRLHQIVDKDNRLISAMTRSVFTLEQFPSTNSTTELAIHSQNLYQELMTLSAHRQDILDHLSETITKQFHTGYMMLDSIMNYAYKKASELNISLTFSTDDTFFNLIFYFLDEEQLSHILADLIQNAIIATKPCIPRQIGVTLTTVHKMPVIQVSDSGVAFPPIVLDHLGKEKCSQHLTDGGSGIGLMDIWELKALTKATLVIEECVQTTSPFSKHINLVFDQKERYIIITQRYKQLTTCLCRSDVIITNLLNQT